VDELVKVQVSLQGTSPMLQHNLRLANPFDLITRRIKEITGKRKKTDKDLRDICELEFRGGLYVNQTLGPYVPSSNIAKCLVEAGKIVRAGRQVQRALFLQGHLIPLLYDGPRTPDELWAQQETYADIRMVGVNNGKVLRTRPIFPEWALEFDAQLSVQQLNLEELIHIIAMAGTMEGLGDARRLGYGRFVSDVKPL
jgi:hypothetical protein